MTKARIKSAWGYQGDAMSLPVADVDSAIPFYENVMGFRVESRNSLPYNSALLERDGIQMQLAENGGDPSQDGCAFEVENVEGIHKEYRESIAGVAGGSVSPELKTENRKDGSSWKVFFVIAPDGLCYWFGERQNS